MTVGELVYKQAVEAGYNPEVISPELKKVAEAYQKAFDTMRGPMKAVSSMVETMQEPMRRAAQAADSMAKALEPQMETMRRLANSSIIPGYPTLPSYLYDEDGEFTLPEFTHRVQEVRIVNPEVLAIPATHPTSEYVITKFTLPPNATWESLDIKFVDGHFVRISYPGIPSRKLDYKDMGFINTKANKPDRKWELLRVMADNGGALTNKNWDSRFSRNVKYELNRQLKAFFGMKETPIPHYNKKDGYHARFTLRGDR